MQDKCTCTDIANQKDAWKVGGIDIAAMGTVFAWVRCSRCGAFWKTKAKYKRYIAGSEDYREAFDKEDATIIRILDERIYKLDSQIRELQSRKAKYERRRLRVIIKQNPFSLYES